MLKRPLFLLIPAILATAFFWPASLYCEISHPDGRVLFSRPVQPGERITLRYRHSVTRQPVDEIWEATARGILILRETVYDSFGAGLPTEPGPGERLILSGERMRLTGMRRELPLITLAVGQIARHTLSIGRERLLLYRLVPAGEPVRIALRRRPWWRWRLSRFRRVFFGGTQT